MTKHRQTWPTVNTADTDGCDPTRHHEPKAGQQVSVEEKMFDRTTDPECPFCGLGCGVRRCRPERGDICCEYCVEDRLFRRTPTTEGSEIECPCCGDVGAVSDARGMYEDGQDLVCGCAGQVTFDAETEPWISICDVTPCEHATPTPEGPKSDCESTFVMGSVSRFDTNTATGRESGE